MKTIPMILLTGILPHLSFSQPLEDFFPLNIGNHWQYAYQSIEKRYDSLFPIRTTSDSGIVQYEIIDSSSQQSARTWTVQEIDSIMRRIQNYNPNTDTSFLLNAHPTFQLQESLDQFHTIQSQSYYEIFTFPVRWTSFGNVTSATPILRFGQDSSLMVIKDNIFLVAVYSDSLVFRKDIGLAYAQSIIDKGPNTLYYYEWKASLLSMTTGVNNRPSATPNTFAIMQNYPNPFNPMTTISFRLPYRSHVVLNISDILGRFVVKLVDSYLEAGYHYIHWNATSQASGIYFCTLLSDYSPQTIKLTLLK